MDRETRPNPLPGIAFPLRGRSAVVRTTAAPRRGGHGDEFGGNGVAQSALARVESAPAEPEEHHEVAALGGGEDRSRLAQTLDAAEERSGRLEDANREVSRRLVAAMESIRDVLARNGSA
jgi:hypothetical protein